MKNLTKLDLVVRISNDTGFTQYDVMAVIQKFLDSVTESLGKGQHVVLRKFGIFQIKVRKPRVGRNPQKPEIIVQIPARPQVKFKVGKEMNEKVKGLSI